MQETAVHLKRPLGEFQIMTHNANGEVTFDSGLFKVYLNELEEEMGTQAANIQYSTTGREFSIGVVRGGIAGNIDTYFFKGNIQDVIVNNYTLSAEEIADRYTNFLSHI